MRSIPSIASGTPSSRRPQLWHATLPIHLRGRADRAPTYPAEFISSHPLCIRSVASTAPKKCGSSTEWPCYRVERHLPPRSAVCCCSQRRWPSHGPWRRERCSAGSASIEFTQECAWRAGARENGVGQNHGTRGDRRRERDGSGPGRVRTNTTEGRFRVGALTTARHAETGARSFTHQTHFLRSNPRHPERF